MKTLNEQIDEMESLLSERETQNLKVLTQKQTVDLLQCAIQIHQRNWFARQFYHLKQPP